MVRDPDHLDDAVVQELRGAGLRVTMPRQVVLTWLARYPHSTAEEIGAGVPEQFGELSFQASYGVLAACTEVGLLRRIEPAGHPARYERRVRDKHHHIVCRRCGRTRPTTTDPYPRTIMQEKA
jgi:Fe2+ or Zn2+ uptake regulation protein